MSWKSIACVAALGAMAAPALALPTISVVDNGGGSGSVFVTTDAAGSVGAELTLELSGATLTGAARGSGFDTDNPGDNPYIAGSPNGGDTTGLGLDLANNRLFASFGSPSNAAGTYEFLSFNYTGTGTATAAGLAAQLSAVTSGLSSGAVNIGGTPGIFGDFEPDGDVDIIDFGVFADAFGSMTGDGNYNVSADSEPDGDVDIIDFGLFADNFGTGTSVAIPEPTAAVLGLIGFACLGSRRV